MQICICRVRVKEWIKISDLLFFQEGPGVRNTQYTQSGVKLLNVANLVNGKVDLSTSDRYISEDEAYGRYKHFLCDDGDFIIASSGIKVEYFDRKMGFVDSSMLPLCMNTSTIRFKVIDSKRLNIKYFMYYLKSIHFKQQLSKFITGSAQLNFGPSHLKKMNMPLVSLKEQNDIVEKLSKVELLLDKYNGEIKLLDELIKARFVEMFGRPTDKITRYPKVKIANLIKEGKASIKAGPFGSSLKKEFYVKKGFKIYGQEQVIKDDPTFGDYYINEERFNSLKSCEVHAGDILISLVGTCGKTMIMPENFEPGIINPRLLKITFDAEFIIPIYFKYFFGSDDLQKTLNSASGHSTMNVVNAGMLKNVELIMAPIELQNQFASFVEEIDKSRLLSNHSLFLIKSIIF